MPLIHTEGRNDQSRLDELIQKANVIKFLIFQDHYPDKKTDIERFWKMLPMF